MFFSQQQLSKFTRAVMLLFLTGALTACAAGQLPWQKNNQPAVPAQPTARALPAAQLPIAQVPKQTTARAATVALLLPLSGQSAQLGQSMLNAAQLAMQDMAPEGLSLAVRDTASQGAAAAFASAAQTGPQLVIGPLFSADVQAVRALAAQQNTPLLTLSNDATLAGRGVYVFGYWPGAQIARVVAYAQSQGKQSFVAIVPDDAYGNAVVAALQSTLRAPAGVLSVVRYAAAGQQGQSPNLAPLQALRGQFDAVLVPEGMPRAAEIAGQLYAANLMQTAAGQPVMLLGSGQWDEPSALQNQNLMRGVFAAANPQSRAAFATKYAESFGTAPPRLASLTYDAVALAAVLASRGWEYNPKSLTLPQGFAGVDGVFRLGQNGLVERGLAILEIAPTGAEVIESAPRNLR